MSPKTFARIAAFAAILLAFAPGIRAQFVQQAKIVAGDAKENDFFGGSVAISGDTAVVGAIGIDGAGGNSGSAYVFTRSGGVWSQQAKIVAEDAAAVDEFGGSVAISGDTAVIGAIGDDDAGSASGSAYVFTRSGGVWSQQAKIVAGDAAADDEFGGSVAISGDTAVVGAHLDDDAGNQSGSAYVFTRSGGVWSQQAKIIAGDAAADDQFGRSVAISGDTSVVGAWLDDDAGGESGSAYVFARSSGVWSQQGKIVAGDAVTGDVFGFSVAISGDTAIVGARYDDDAGIGSGSAYVFTRTGGIWTQQAKIVAGDAASGDSFGYSVAIDGDTAVVGAWLGDLLGRDNGSAYVFARSGGVWTQEAKIFAVDGAAGDVFGISVASSGDTVIVGSHSDDSGPNTNSGSAYIFIRQSAIFLLDILLGRRLVSRAIDFNDDGVVDISDYPAIP